MEDKVGRVYERRACGCERKGGWVGRCNIGVVKWEAVEVGVAKTPRESRRGAYREKR